MNIIEHNPHAGKTAIKRHRMSTPTRWLLDNGYLSLVDGNRLTRVLDYGAGKGDDVDALKAMDFFVHGYDPHHERFKHERPSFYYDVVLCNYVLNVTRDDKEMQEIMYLASTKLRPHGKAYFSVRRDMKPKDMGLRRTGAYQRDVYPEKFISNKYLKSIHVCAAFEIYELNSWRYCER